MALPLALGIIGLGLQGAGIIGSRRESKRAARAERRAGKRAEEAAEFTADQYETKAGQERAIGSRDVAEEARRGRIATSMARAIGAASGAGGYDTNIADIEGEADYRMLTALYNSEQSARDLELAAEISRREGADAARAHAAQAGAYRRQGNIIALQGAADIFGGAMTLYERYGQPYRQEVVSG